MTDSEPMREQIVIYTYIDVVPWTGATYVMRYIATANAVTTYNMNPATHCHNIRHNVNAQLEDCGMNSGQSSMPSLK